MALSPLNNPTLYESYRAAYQHLENAIQTLSAIHVENEHEHDLRIIELRKVRAQLETILQEIGSTPKASR